MQLSSIQTLQVVRTMLTVSAAIVIVILGLEVRALRGFQAQVQRMKALPHAGQTVPTVQVATITGDSLTLGETSTGRAQLVFAFSTTCQFCLATLPHWQRLSDSLRRDPRSRFDVVWVSGSSWDSTRVYAQRHALNESIVRFPTAKLARVYQVKAVPLTVVIDRWGRVEYVHASTFRTGGAIDSVYAAAYRAAAADSIWASAASPSQVSRR